MSASAVISDYFLVQLLNPMALSLEKIEINEAA